MVKTILLNDVRDTVYAYSGSNVEYIGLAHPGAGIDEAKWQIKKLFYSGNNVTGQRFADGDVGFNKIWNNRADYEYKTVT